MLKWFMVPVVILAVGIFIKLMFYPESCNMDNPSNRDFNKYFGLTVAQNHFMTRSADECNIDYLYRPALPQAVIKPDRSSSTFVILAPYGTGKTMLRCAFDQNLDKRYFKVILLNTHLSEYIQRFVSANGKNNSLENSLENWESKDFAQILLSVLVTQFLSQFNDRWIDLANMSMDEKMDLIFIACYYFDRHATIELENFANSLFKKTGFFASPYKEQDAITQTKENNRYEDKVLLIQFKNDIRNFKILDLNQNSKLHLLLAIVEGEKYQHNAKSKQMHETVFQDLVKFSSFMKKHMGKKVVFIIDGIDENQNFFSANGVNVPQLNRFYQSSVSQEIVVMTMANHFDLAMFYVAANGVELSDVIIRKDKFPIYTVTWNTKSLLNYADYILEKLRSLSASSRCKPIPSFKNLVNYSDERIAEIVNKIPTPRALHFFMTELIREMNSDAAHVQQPFIANFDNINNASEKSKKSFNQVRA